MTQNQTDDPFAGGNGLPSISFATKDQYGNMTSKPVGTRIGGTVLKAPSMQQSRNFTTKKPEFWDDGNPKMSVVVDLQVDCGGEGEMSLWVKKPSALFKAFQEAKGDTPVTKGSKVYVTLVGFGKPEADKAPAKLYKVEFTPGDAFAAEAPATSVQAPPPPPSSAPAVAPAPPVAAPAPEPVLSNGFTATQLRAAQWTEAQIAALSAPAPVPAPQAAPAPPAAPAPAEAPAAAVDAAAAERQAKIDAMTPEDRAILGV